VDTVDCRPWGTFALVVTLGSRSGQYWAHEASSLRCLDLPMSSLLLFVLPVECAFVSSLLGMVRKTQILARQPKSASFEQWCLCVPAARYHAGQRFQAVVRASGPKSGDSDCPVLKTPLRTKNYQLSTSPLAGLALFNLR